MKSRSRERKGTVAKPTLPTQNRNAAVLKSGIKVEVGIVSRQMHTGRNLDATQEMATVWPNVSASDHI